MADVRSGAGQIQGDIASGSTDAGNPIKIGGIATSGSPSAVSPSQRVNALFDLKGRQYNGVYEVPDATVDFTPSCYDTIAYAGSGVIKNTPGVVYGFTGFNSGPYDQFLQLYDVTAIANNGMIPKLMLFIQSSGNFFYDGGKFGIYFSSGIAWNNSTTGPTKWNGSADCWLNLQYK